MTPPSDIRMPAADRVASATAVLAGFALLGKGFGLVRELIIAQHFGAGAELDAFLVAFTLPEMLSVVSLYVALNLFLPVYMAEHARDPVGARALASAFWGRTTLVLVLLSGGLALLAPIIVRLLDPELEGPLFRIAVQSLRLLSLVVLFRGMEGTLRGLVHAHRRFVIPAVAGILVSLVIIALVVAFAGRIGIMALTWGVAAGAVVPVLFVLPLALRTVPGLLRDLAGTHPMMREVTRLLPWFVAIEVASLVMPFVDRSIAARFLGEGRISALTYAKILYEVPFDLVGITLATVLFPEFAALLARGDRDGFQRAVRRGVRAAVAVILPAAVLLIVLRLPVVRAVYERGAFDAEATRLTAGALWAYALGLPFMAGMMIVIQAAYAARLMRRILGLKLIALVLKVSVSLLGLRWLGHAGIALGTSVFFAFLFLALVPSVTGGWRRLVPSPGVLSVASALAGAAGWGGTRVLAGMGVDRGVPALIGQAVIWGVAGLVYLGICRWGRVEEVLWAERLVIGRFLGRRSSR